MVHLVYKSHHKSIFLCKNTMRFSVLLKTHYLKHEVGFQLKKLSVKSPRICLRSENKWHEIPKKVPEIPKKGPLLSQKICLTIVRHVFQDLFWDSKRMLDNQLYRKIQISWTIVSQLFWDPQASFFGLSGLFFGMPGIFLGIARLFLGYKKESKRGEGVWFLCIQRVFVLSDVNVCYKSKRGDHVNHPFKSSQKYI